MPHAENPLFLSRKKQYSVLREGKRKKIL